MKTKVVLASLFLCLTLATPKGFGAFVAGDNTLVSQTNEAVVIVAGKVSSIQYVQPDLNVARVYTDVTITVSRAIKGRPNINNNTVRFRIEGGTGIHPANGRVFMERVSTTPEFKVGQELILFLVKRTLDDWTAFYNGLYPLVYPPYLTVKTHRENGNEVKVVNFHLGFYNDKYSLNVPMEVAFRLLDTAIKAPDDVASLEERIRPIKDIQRPENQTTQIESENFLSMLESELTKIEAKIEARETSDER
jgi:hypothetical protein